MISSIKICMNISAKFSPTETTAFPLPEKENAPAQGISATPSDAAKELHAAAAQAKEIFFHYTNETHGDIDDVTSEETKDHHEMPKKEKLLPIAFDDEAAAFLRSVDENPQKTFLIKNFVTALASWKAAKEALISLEQQHVNQVDSLNRRLEKTMALREQAKGDFSGLQNKTAIRSSMGLASVLGRPEMDKAQQKILQLDQKSLHLKEELELLQSRSLVALKNGLKNPNEKLLQDLDQAKKKFHEADRTCRELSQQIEQIDDLEFSSSNLNGLQKLGASGKELLHEGDAAHSEKFDAFLKADFDEQPTDPLHHWIQAHDFRKD